MKNIKVLHYDRVNSSETIDVNNTRESRKYNTCHYWYCLNEWFKFQPNVYNRCHDLLMMFMNLKDIAILSIKSAYYHCAFIKIS